MSKAWVVVGVSAALIIAPLASKAQPSPGSGSATTNRPAPATAATAPGTTAPAPDAELKVPQAPGRLYTNVVGMQLVQVGDFWAGKFEVTQAEYEKVMGSNPSAFAGATRPVDSVSYADALEFCQRLTVKDIEGTNLPPGYVYNLPTEAQWESLTGDASLDDAVTSQKDRRSGTEPVGSLGPNSLGLYDTRGNVLEFTLSSDPTLAYRVLRGGSWQDFIEINLRLVFRNYSPVDDRKNTYGFRCVLEKQ